jgi:hypothetical protein
MAERWLTSKDLAQQWSMDSKTVVVYINRGYRTDGSGPFLKATKFGSWRILPEDADAFMAEVRALSEREPTT